MSTIPLSPVSYEPIKAVRVLGSSAATPFLIRAPEAATQTFKVGTPTMLDGSGNQIPFATNAANIIYGISSEPAHNLTTAATAQDESEGAPQNQPNAVTTAVGAWPRDGNVGVYGADGRSVFSIALKLGQTYTGALLIAGTLYGIVKDATSGFWYLDNTVTTGNGAVAELLGVDSTCPNSAVYGCRVFFQIAAAKRYFQ